MPQATVKQCAVGGGRGLKQREKKKWERGGKKTKTSATRVTTAHTQHTGPWEQVVPTSPKPPQSMSQSTSLGAARRVE
jgi:hypothetical protein